MIRLAVRVQREQAELVLAELLELAPSGVEEVEVDSGVVEYAVYGAPGELPALPDLTAAAAGALVEVRTDEVADDWDQRWREFHRPLVLDPARPRLSVRPPWIAPLGTPIELVIDPGQAFGTGAHATTRLCLELMLELPPAGPFLDLGCGSGVLAIAAARLGWAPVLAVDNDPASVTAAAENALVNGVEVEVRRHDLRRDPVVSAPTVAANLLRPLLVAWAARLAGGGGFGVPAGPAGGVPGVPAGLAGGVPGVPAGPTGGVPGVPAGPAGGVPGVPAGLVRGVPEVPARLIASGLLVGEEDEVVAAFDAAGLVETRRCAAGEWAALLLERHGG